MPTRNQFSKLIEPQPGNIKISMHIDKDRVAFLKQNIRFVTEKLDSTTCTKLGALGSQIMKLGSKRKEDYKINYAAYKNGNKHGFGRVQPIHVNDVAYVAVTRPVRQFLVSGFCTDIDIKNCHPVFMNQLYKMFTREDLEDLDRWNENREQYFELVISKSSKAITRDDAKKLAFTFMYEGSIDKAFEDLGISKDDPDLKVVYDNLDGLKTTAIKLANTIAKDYPEMWESLPSEKTGTLRERASKFSILMQHLERRCVDQIRLAAEGMGLLVHDICHDGLLVSCDLQPLSDEVAKELCNMSERKIREICGFDVQVLAKEMDNPHARELEKWFFSYSDVDSEIESDSEAVNKFLAKYQDRIVFSCGEWYIRPLDSFFWKKGDESVCNAIANCRFTKDGSPYGSNNRGIMSIFKNLRFRIDELTNNGFIAELNEKLVGKVYWVDKHLDVETGTLSSNNPESTLAPIIYINRPAPDFGLMSDSDEGMTKLNLLLQGMRPEQRIDYYKIVGRFGAGYVRDKQWVALEGLRNTSKSSINNIVCKSFAEYATCVNSPFIQRYDADSAAKNRWLLTCGCHLKRIAIMAEKDTTVDRDGNPMQSVLDGNIIKKVIANGGNDTVIARNHCQGETKIVVNTCFISSFNGMPRADPPDAMETLIPFSLEIKFTDDDKQIEKYPEMFMKRDETIANYINDPDVQDHFLWCCLIRYYEPHKFSSTGGSMEDELNEIRDMMGEKTPLGIYNRYFTSDPDGKYDTDQAVAFFRNNLNDPNYTQNKLTRFMGKMGHKHIKGSGQKYYKGLKLIELESDEPNLDNNLL